VTSIGGVRLPKRGTKTKICYLAALIAAQRFFCAVAIFFRAAALTCRFFEAFSVDSVAIAGGFSHPKNSIVFIFN